jgi:Helix-turn-helix domain
VAGSARFTRIPKITDLRSCGVPTEVIPTYCALTDYSNNRSGLCWPKMETLAHTLGRSIRTIQRHVHLLAKLGLIELLERRRNKGRFSSYLYRIVHITRTTGHGRRIGGTGSIKGRTKSFQNSPSHEESADVRRERDAKRRVEGYEWLFT